MKIAVTGCNGSVGERVVALALKRGHTIVDIDYRSAGDNTHPNFEFVQADLKVYEVALSVLEGCEGVIHLAALLVLGNIEANVHNRCEVMVIIRSVELMAMLLSYETYFERY